ncbi:MAG TPA: glycosyltransferase family 39 protein [Candidatus Saccharimonadales bacterium]|nr:glycosyltransferase family 39 protein [Candidatus Saccharimonadales bacterium]
MQKNALLYLVLILLGACIVRLYRFDNPIADWHSWRQADTSAVSRNFVQHGYDILHPRFDDISNVPSGLDNPNGYRFVEFPIYNIAQAGLYQIFHGFTLEEWGRIVTILSSLLATLFLYLIVSNHLSKKAGLFTAFFYAFVPYNIYYGRTILPDPSMVMAVLGGIYFFDLWLKKSEKRKAKNEKENSQLKNYLYLLISLLFTATACLLKPYALFFCLPMGYLAWEVFGWSLFKKWQLWLVAILTILPLVLWRQWISQYAEGIPANAWLLNGNGIRFRPAFFRWILYERLTKLISAYFGLIFLGYGIFQLRKSKSFFFFLSFLIASALYVIVFATGNVQHDYYQILISPSLAIFYGIGAYYLWERKNVTVKIAVVLVTIGMFYVGWMYVKDYFNINNRSIVVAGHVVDKLTPKNAKVIAPYDGDTSFLYQTNRRGWPSFEHSTEDLVKMGATYLVFVNPTKQEMTIGKKYKIVASSPQYILVNLKQKP